MTSAPAQQTAPVEAAAPASADDAPPWDEGPASSSPSASAALAQVEANQPEPAAAAAAAVAAQPQSDPEPNAEPAPESENLAPLAEPTNEAEVATWWAALLLRLDVDGTVRNIARNAVLISREESVWTLRISPGHQVLVNKERLEELSGALGNYFQRRIQVQVEFEQQPGETPERMAEARRQELLAQAKDTLHADPVVQQLVTTFAGRLDEESVTPKETVE